MHCLNSCPWCAGSWIPACGKLYVVDLLLFTSIHKRATVNTVHISLAIDHTYILCSGIFYTFAPLPFSLYIYMYIYFFHSTPLSFTSLQSLFSLLHLISLNHILSPSSLSFLSCRNNIMNQCWQQKPEDRPTFFQLADKLKSYYERVNCASVGIDDDLSDIAEEGEFKQGDSNRYWL